MISDPSRPGTDPVGTRSRESFGRDRRIRRRADYLETYSTGRRVVGRWLVVFVKPAARPVSRLGVTITKKTGSAVVRNRLRRRLKELFRRTAAFPGGVDVVVNVRPGAERTEFVELARDFDRLARRASSGERA